MRWHVAALASIALATSVMAVAGQGGAAQPSPARTARASAPVDLTGYWVSLITEDWRFRMVTPPKGDYASVPINQMAKNVADAWDPAKDEAANEQCRSYGAPGLMRLPLRLRIAWADANTLRMESDAGKQVRTLRFAEASQKLGAPSWQGDSTASWQAGGTLRVVTTNLRPGYLRKNGIPYSGSTTLTEYWDLHLGDAGEQWLVITSIVNDPTYLQLDYVTSPNFRKDSDGSKWAPTPCSSR